MRNSLVRVHQGVLLESSQLAQNERLVTESRNIRFRPLRACSR